MGLFHGHAALDHEVDVGQATGVEVELAPWGVFRDAGILEILVEITGWVGGNIEEGIFWSCEVCTLPVIEA